MWTKWMNETKWYSFWAFLLLSITSNPHDMLLNGTSFRLYHLALWKRWNRMGVNVDGLWNWYVKLLQFDVYISNQSARENHDISLGFLSILGSSLGLFGPQKTRKWRDPTVYFHNFWSLIGCSEYGVLIGSSLL